MNNYEFKSLKSTQKGQHGENVFQKYFSKGFPDLKLYSCSHQNIGSHCCDGIIMKGKEIIAYYDVKTKPRRFKFEDTGIDYYSFKRYLQLKQNNKTYFYLFFIDQLTREIYFNELSVLERNKRVEKHFNGSTIVYFMLEDMRVLATLNQKDCQALAKNTQMNNRYFNRYNNIRTCSEILNMKNGVENGKRSQLVIE